MADDHRLKSRTRQAYGKKRKRAWIKGQRESTQVVPKATQSELQAQDRIDTDPEVANQGGADREVFNHKVADHEDADHVVVDHEVADRKVSDREIANPEVSDPEVSDPEVSDPEVSDPEVADPEVADPEVADPKVADPKLSDPEATPSTSGLSGNRIDTMYFTAEDEVEETKRRLAAQSATQRKFNLLNVDLENTATERGTEFIIVDMAVLNEFFWRTKCGQCGASTVTLKKEGKDYGLAHKLVLVCSTCQVREQHFF
ncbi:hypothetical protein ANAPC5_01397 [Anaplasma phagocytophilum]|nr:hypothetical protein ANAPC5_01397 [Anaplasma phagocytophilum]